MKIHKNYQKKNKFNIFATIKVSVINFIKSLLYTKFIYKSNESSIYNANNNYGSRERKKEKSFTRNKQMQLCSQQQKQNIVSCKDNNNDTHARTHTESSKTKKKLLN